MEGEKIFEMERDQENYIQPLPNLNHGTTDRTHARTGPDTQRAQAHNHTQTDHRARGALIACPVCVRVRKHTPAIKAVIPPAAPPAPVVLCDRGDGSPASKETARQRWAHVNAGHVPDIARLGSRSGGVSYTIWWGFLYDTYPDVS